MGIFGKCYLLLNNGYGLSLISLKVLEVLVLF